MMTPVPKVGAQYLKLKTGEKVKWQKYDESTKLFEFKLPNGTIGKVHLRDVEVTTSDNE